MFSGLAAGTINDDKVQLIDRLGNQAYEDFLRGLRRIKISRVGAAQITDEDNLCSNTSLALAK